jgi:proline dehydrogenase
MLNFNNTLIAFSDKSTTQLKKAFWMFWMVKRPWMVKIGSFFILIANKLRIPLGWALKNTVFSHFCGGETLEECDEAIKEMSKSRIKAVIDYAAEGIDSEKEYELATERILATIEMGATNNNIGFAVFKFTGIASFRILEKASNQLIISTLEQKELDSVKQRAYRICQKAAQKGLPVMIDAEETWIQDAIDQIAEELMQTFNKETPLVYHTLQMYRTDRFYYLKKLTSRAKDQSFIPAFKLVRGAYMEKERKRALKRGYISPIHPNKEATDSAFNEAIRFCIENIDNISVCVGTHNEQSCHDTAHFMNLYDLPADHERIYFSQLKGMSDHISYNLAEQGYNVSKYLPYGPLRLVLPYLIRRAEENTSVAGQTGRELFLIKKELKRRKREKSQKNKNPH